MKSAGTWNPCWKKPNNRQSKCVSERGAIPKEPPINYFLISQGCGDKHIKVYIRNRQNDRIVIHITL